MQQGKTLCSILLERAPNFDENHWIAILFTGGFYQDFISAAKSVLGDRYFKNIYQTSKDNREKILQKFWEKINCTRAYRVNSNNFTYLVNYTGYQRLFLSAYYGSSSKHAAIRFSKYFNYTDTIVYSVEQFLLKNWDDFVSIQYELWQSRKYEYFFLNLPKEQILNNIIAKWEKANSKVPKSEEQVRVLVGSIHSNLDALEVTAVQELGGGDYTEFGIQDDRNLIYLAKAIAQWAVLYGSTVSDIERFFSDFEEKNKLKDTLDEIKSKLESISKLKRCAEIIEKRIQDAVMFNEKAVSKIENIDLDSIKNENEKLVLQRRRLTLYENKKIFENYKLKAEVFSHDIWSLHETVVSSQRNLLLR